MAPEYEAVAAMPGVIPSPYETTPNSTLWFTSGSSYPSAFASMEEALLSFQEFLQKVTQLLVMQD